MILKAQYSDGEDLLLNGSPYIGFYHIEDKEFFTGKIPQDNRQRLVSRANNPSIFTYIDVAKNLVEIREPIKPYSYIPQPSLKDYQRGKIKRFFIGKRNDPSIIWEVKEKDYLRYLDNLGNELYYGTSLQWTIVGITNGDIETSPIRTLTVEDLNQKEIVSASKIIPGLRNYLSNFLQFYRKPEQFPKN